jgi:hypothetical protein
MDSVYSCENPAFNNEYFEILYNHYTKLCYVNDQLLFCTKVPKIFNKVLQIFSKVQNTNPIECKDFIRKRILLHNLHTFFNDNEFTFPAYVNLLRFATIKTPLDNIFKKRMSLERTSSSIGFTAEKHIKLNDLYYNTIGLTKHSYTAPPQIFYYYLKKN